MLGPFATMSRLTSIHQMSLAVLSRAACALISTTTTTTTTTTRDRGDRYGPMEWAQWKRRKQTSLQWNQQDKLGVLSRTQRQKDSSNMSTTESVRKKVNNYQLTADRFQTADGRYLSAQHSLSLSAALQWLVHAATPHWSCWSSSEKS